MKVHLIKERTIQRYVQRHASSVVSFEEWLNKIKQSDWEIPSDIKSTFSSVDFLGDGSNRVVFDIGGNRFRLICAYWFGKNQVHIFVKWIGTHAEYDKLCRDRKQYTISVY